MPHFSRFLWGLCAGFVVVLVKVIGVDANFIKPIVVSGNHGELSFYLLVSAGTVLLGGFSGLFSKSTEPMQILVFCASFPALVTTALSPDRSSPPTGPINPVEKASLYMPSVIEFDFISNAMAQTTAVNSRLVCDEGSFSKQFKSAAKTYFGMESKIKSTAVIIASEDSFERAKSIADTFAERTDNYDIYVGCRKPGNPYFPVIVGKPTDFQTAAEVKGEIVGEGWAPTDTYLSNYAYRETIYRSQ